MKLISIVELESKTELELSALFIEVSRRLARSEGGSPERRNSLASLETISAARVQIAMAGP